MGVRKRLLVAFVASLAAVTSACATSGLSIRQDKRVDITAPADGEKVALPARIAWSVKDFRVGSAHGSFGVFIDQTPQRPGRTLQSLFAHSEECRGLTGCPDKSFLARHNIHQTSATAFTLDHLPAKSGTSKGRQFHEVTVVLLDAAGKRVGEGAWAVRFEVPDDK